MTVSRAGTAEKCHGKSRAQIQAGWPGWRVLLRVAWEYPEVCSQVVPTAIPNPLWNHTHLGFKKNNPCRVPMSDLQMSVLTGPIFYTQKSLPVPIRKILKSKKSHFLYFLMCNVVGEGTQRWLVQEAKLNSKNKLHKSIQSLPDSF